MSNATQRHFTTLLRNNLGAEVYLRWAPDGFWQLTVVEREFLDGRLHRTPVLQQDVEALTQRDLTRLFHGDKASLITDWVASLIDVQITNHTTTEE